MTRKYGYLCAVIVCLTVALTVGCGGNPQRVTTFKLGPDGRPDMSTAKEEVVVDRQALISAGVAYTWNCDGDGTIFGGELKNHLYSGAPLNGYCLGFGAGGNNAMGLALHEWTWPGLSSTLSNSVGSYEAKAADLAGTNPETHHGQGTWFRNNQGGGGNPNQDLFGPTGAPGVGVADTLANPGGYWWADLDTGDSRGSVYLARWCGPGQTPC
jgi:hypothetical protein